MLQSYQVETLITLLAAMDRPTLVHQLRNYHASFPLDFTPDFLASSALDDLRHIFLAVCLQSQRMPESAEMQLTQAA